MATFVLVHGAWCGSWAWRRLTPLLLQRGHAAHAPTLTGLAERAHLLDADVDLATHVQDVVSLLRWEELDDVVLCGHSYGGMVISGVVEAVPERIRSAVYLDAFLPEDGRSLLEYMPPERAAALVAAAEAHDGMSIPPVIPASAFGTRPADCAWIDSRCRPQPLETFRQGLKLTDTLGRLPKRTYVRATGYEGTFTQFQTRTADDPTWESVTAPCGHFVMTDMPERLTEILEEAI
jgi:pimeloyl-ACP methyl ester carboxylesterase